MPSSRKTLRLPASAPKTSENTFENKPRSSKPWARRKASTAKTTPIPDNAPKESTTRSGTSSSASVKKERKRADDPYPRTEARKPKPAWAHRGKADTRTTRRQKSPTVSVQEGVRVSKLLAERGICSRREADEYIEQGWVFVEGKRITLGARAAPDAEITLSPAAKKKQQHRVTILLHKPVGYVSAQPEDGHPAAVSLIMPENQFRPNDSVPVFNRMHLRELAPAGRLDIDSTGLLVLTQDGRIARRIIGEDSAIEKEYLVRVEGTLSDTDLALLNHGLALDGVALKPAEVTWQNQDQLRFILREGKKRQIRRMCEAVGLTVTGLKRVRIGKLRLGNLPLGQWRYLQENESF